MNKTLILPTLLITASTAFGSTGGSGGASSPAAANCLKLGGQLASNSSSSTTGICTIEEWTLFRRTPARRGGQSPTMGMGNPASANCENIGGHLKIVNEAAGQVGYCSIDLMTLFRMINVIGK